MVDVSGDFEIHITTYAHHAEGLATFAARHGLKFVHVVLDRGAHVSQPMLTVAGSGTLDAQQSVAKRWHAQLREARLHPCRTKIEAAPWCTGVPQHDADAADEPTGRYFEHHVKVLLQGVAVADLTAITDLVTPHGARLSRNARRVRADGRQERFVNQRCHGVGLSTAQHRLDKLVSDLRTAGYEVLVVEQEYVVFDNHIGHDSGWLEEATPADWSVQRETRMRSAPAGAPDYPPTYQPLTGSPAVRQTAAFDPALKQHPNAYRAGEPVFLVAADGQRWRSARRAAMNHLLTVITALPWAEHLVLRGSVPMAAWVGDAAREPGDLDFVVTPHTITSDSTDARALLDGIVAAAQATPGAGLQPDRTVQSAIWTYERADGRRLVIPFSTANTPDGNVQIDIVFGERLPVAPDMLVLPGVQSQVLAATPELSLAWKLLWLATDIYPQGKDLYDAVLLAEYTTVHRILVQELMRPELGAEADDFSAETVLSWAVDWGNLHDEYPGIAGTSEQWLRRLATALDRAWS